MATIKVKLKDQNSIFTDSSQGVTLTGTLIASVKTTDTILNALRGGAIVKLSEEEIAAEEAKIEEAKTEQVAQENASQENVENEKAEEKAEEVIVVEEPAKVEEEATKIEEDPKERQYVNPSTNRKIGYAKALELGLIDEQGNEI